MNIPDVEALLYATWVLREHNLIDTDLSMNLIGDAFLICGNSGANGPEATANAIYRMWFESDDDANRYVQAIFNVLGFTSREQEQLATAVVYGGMKRYEEALMRLERLSTTFRESNQTQYEGEVHLEIAKIRVAIGDVERAEASCELASQLITESDSRRGEVYRIQAAIALRRGDYDEAIRFLQVAAVVFEEMGFVGEWSKIMYEVAQLHAQKGEYEQAFNIMEDVREFSRFTIGCGTKKS